MKKNIVILASGRGSNAQKLIEFTQAQEANFVVTHIISNRKGAGVVEVASENNVSFSLIDKDAVKEGLLLKVLIDLEPDFIVLAGYLLMIPEAVVQAFEGKIINLHPSLLPAYGGKGMYGSNVHKAVLADGITETGISIHFVNEEYDKGELIAQHSCAIESGETLESLQKKIALLEHSHFPKTLNTLCADGH